jgi:NAD(P)-dependent dehydrogenase (short-subunit alcohol dehydrogenase family)/acyl carrier protein
MLPWIGAGFLATGAATTEEVVERAALPFDRRRHGMLIGMGACGLVLEAQEALEERGMRGLCEVLATETANSAFHGTRLDVGHIAEVMERLVARAEERHSLSRREMAREMVFVSHETFTPARGGSAAAEVTALRRTFGPDADAIVVANTKGFTGHPQGVGIEDAMAVKILERGLVPPVPNFREPDPELGTLNLSRGGKYPARYALRLAAGFGSQVSMTLERRIPDAKDRVADEPRYQRWLADVSGYDRPALIVEKRTLRVRDDGLPARDPVRSAWTIGTVPKAKAPVEESKPEAQAPAPPAAVPPAAATTASPTASPVEAADPVAEKVLGLVSEKTGYPRDMLELDLDLEADLGIDTVKQAEVFALVREAFGIPRQENLKLRDYPTLRHVIGFVKAVRPEAVPTTPDGAQAPTVPGAPITDEVADRVLGLVSEKTGYPRDMLELDLDLEADLGIDTVKQAEIFAMVREAFRIPRQDNLKLRDYPTLRHVIGFVRELKPAAAKATATGTAAVKSLAETQGLLRVPTPTLRPALELCKETAVKLDWGSRVVVVADRGGAGALLARKLEELGVDVLRVNDRPSPAEMKALVGEWMSTGPVAGAYFLPALDPEPPLGELDLAAWRGLHAERVALLCALARALYSTLSERDTFLLAATRMGGLHGFGPGGALGPSAGAVTGFVKALARERPHALVKAIDFEEGAEAEAVATALMDETRRDPGAIEIGWRDGSRWAIGVLPFEELAPADLRPMVLYENSVFLVTGGAGAITGEIVRDLAQACHGTFHLVDARPFPDETVRADLARLEGDREGLQRALFERLKSEGERATPALVEKRLLDLERAQGILDGLRRVEEAGGRAFYHQADVTDADAVHGVIDQIRQQDGRLDVIVHAAGLERSRTLDQKPEEEFDLVFGVKAHGLFNLLDATRDLELRALVCFSSVAGRFGNAGQTDYSAANDLMAKLASAWSAARPGSRHVVTDWTAWGEIGMATRGSVPEMLRRAGIEPLSPAEAVPIVRLALTEGFRGELVVGRKLGVLLERGDPEGGIDPAALARRRLEGKPPALRFADLSLDVNQGLRATLTLDPREEPFLRDHAIDGTPVLPGVMGIEAFAELALLLAPGHHVAAIEDVRFLAPLKYYRGEPRTAILRALPLRAGPGKIRVHATLGATQAIVGAKEPPEERVLFSASVLLAPGPAPAALSTAEPTLALAEASRTLARDVIYRIYFHGPAYRVLSWVERSLGDSLNGAFAANLPPETSEPGATCVFSPRLVELCFQTAGVWEIGVTGQLGLPAALDRVSVRGIPPPEVQLTAEIFPYSARSASDGEEELFFDAHVRDPEGRVYVELRGYRTSRLPEGLPEDLLAPFRRVVQSQTESTAGR